MREEQIKEQIEASLSKLEPEEWTGETRLYCVTLHEYFEHETAHELAIFVAELVGVYVRGGFTIIGIAVDSSLCSAEYPGGQVDLEYSFTPAIAFRAGWTDERLMEDLLYWIPDNRHEEAQAVFKRKIAEWRKVHASEPF